VWLPGNIVLQRRHDLSSSLFEAGRTSTLFEVHSKNKSEKTGPQRVKATGNQSSSPSVPSGTQMSIIANNSGLAAVWRTIPASAQPFCVPPAREKAICYKRQQFCTYLQVCLKLVEHQLCLKSIAEISQRKLAK
jgi:hypothetical protein